MAFFDFIKRREGTPASAVVQTINKEAIDKAQTILNQYKSGKAALEARIVEDEKWYRLRHWDTIKKSSKDDIEPTSAWLFNCIMNKHADCMDNMPAASILPREEGDKAEAKALTSILPVILEQNDFEKTYSGVMTHKLRGGTGVYGVFWDSSKLNGLGDISITDVDVLNLFWEPGVTDIQNSQNLFYTRLVDNDALEGMYPQLTGKLGSANIAVAQYITDESIDTTKKSVVVDWYYKKIVDGKTILHFVTYCNGIVLYATENDTEPLMSEDGQVIKPPMSETGLYDHGMYPFVFDPMFTVEASPAGFGYIDVGKDAQMYIDRGNKAILKNMLSSAAPRYFIRSDGAVKEEEYADFNKSFIHVDGNLGQDSIVPAQRYPLDGVYINVLEEKINEIKETTGTRDVSTGGTASGVTAASAIAALQEAGSKLSRDMNKASFRAFRSVVSMIIELIRQYYDVPRKFRILGERGAEEYVTYSNANIIPQAQGEDFGANMGYTMPVFDVEVAVEKQSAYSRMAQNELALSFYSAGFFNPQMADQALACLNMMDFDRKQFVMDDIQKNGGMYQQMLRMQQALLDMAALVDKQNGTNFADQVASQVNGTPAPQNIEPARADGMGRVEKAKAEAAERSAPR